MTDSELLQQYIAGSQQAFAELAGRYTGMVYSACMRKLSDHHLAEEASQTVFIVLAKKASSLPEKTVLPGWLIKTAYFASMNLIKTEKRRKNREQEVSDMNNGLSEEDRKVWAELTPYLDEALLSLDETDRNAVVLRFFQHKSNEEIGTELNMKPGTVSQRISRALEKLEKIFSKKGVAVSAVVLSAVLAQNAVQAAPPAVTAACAVAGAGTAAQTLNSTVQGVLTMVLWTKAKITALAISITVLITALTGSAAFFGIEAAKDEMKNRLSEKEALLEKQERELDELRETVSLLKQQADKDEEKLTELENMNWDLRQKQKTAAETAENPAPAAPVTEAETTVAENAEDEKPAEDSKEEPGDFIEAYAKMMKDPNMQKMLKTQTRQALDMFYSDLFNELVLTEEQKGKLKDLMAEVKIEEMMAGIDSITAKEKLSPEEIQKLADAATEKPKAEIRELLGEDQYKLYEQYELEFMEHYQVRQFQDKIAASDFPLEDFQKQELLKVLKEEKTTAAAEAPEDLMKSYDSIEWSKEDLDRQFARQKQFDEKVILRSSNFLVPKQVEAYREFLESQRAMQRSQIEMSQKILKSRFASEKKE